MIEEMRASVASTSSGHYRSQIDQSQSALTLEQQAVNWKFTMLDRNGDGDLSRQELRPLRRELIANPTLRLCGKRLQIHCDFDKDRRVSRSEWDVCLEIRKGKFSC